MLISDPLGEGSNASFTDSELWRAEKSTLRMRGNSDAQKGAACSWVTLVGEGSSASQRGVLKSGELIPQSEETQTPRRERHAHR